MPLGTGLILLSELLEDLGQPRARPLRARRVGVGRAGPHRERRSELSAARAMRSSAVGWGVAGESVELTVPLMNAGLPKGSVHCTVKVGSLP